MVKLCVHTMGSVVHGKRRGLVLCKLFNGLGFVISDLDESLYTRVAKGARRTKIVAYVNDMLIVGQDESELRTFADQIEENVPLIKDPYVTKFLAIYLDYNKEKKILNISLDRRRRAAQVSAIFDQVLGMCVDYNKKKGILKISNAPLID